MTGEPERPGSKGGEPLRAGNRLAPSVLIAAVVLLILIAAVTYS